MHLAGVRPAIRRRVRRHRRPLAAGLAAAGVLVGLGTLRGAEPAPGETGPGSTPSVASVADGEVAVPVLLTSAAVAGTLTEGDVIDVVGISGRETATATIVAAGATVLEIPSGGSNLTAASSAIVIVAVAERDALPLSAAAANGAVSVLIRAR